MPPKFTTKAGWLTPYALSCGYRETEQSENRILTLKRDPNATVYTVTLWDSETSQLIMNNNFHKLTDARKSFSKLRAYMRKR